MEFWGKLTTLLLGSGGVVTLVVTHMVKQRAARLEAERELEKKQRLEAKKARTKSIWSSIAQVHDVLNEIIQETDVGRVVVLKARNSGGVPSPVSPAFSSALYDETDGSIPSITKGRRWIKVRADDTYAHILSELANTGTALVVTGKMKDCPLKNLYQRDGVAFSVVKRIAAIDNQMVYLSANYSKMVPLSDSEQPLVLAGDLDVLRVAVSALRKLVCYIDPEFHEAGDAVL